MIYFIQAEIVGYIKIGYTTKDGLARRLSALQIGSPVPLKVLATLHGNKQAEAELHERFAASRLHGEWFTPSADLVRFICRIRGHKARRAVRSSRPSNSRIRQKIMAVFSGRPGDRFSPGRMTELVGENPSSVRSELWRMLGEGSLAKVGQEYLVGVGGVVASPGGTTEAVP